MTKDAQIGLWTVTVMTLVILYTSFRESGIIDFNQEVGLLFTQVYGLRAGDPVTIGGVPAGRVVKIDFAPSAVEEMFAPITGGTKLVRAAVSLDNGRKIPKESTYAVRIDLNGRRWLDITFSPGKEMVGPSDNFLAEVSAGQEDQLQRTIRTFSTLSKQTEELRAQLSDPNFLLQTKDTASNLRFYSREMVAASGLAPEQLAALEKSMDKQELLMLQQIESFDQKTQEVGRRMTEMAPQLSETLQGWSLRMERQSERLTATLQMTAAKAAEYQKLLDQVPESLDPEVVERLILQTKKWSRQLQEYRYLAEDLHSLTSDPTIRSDLKKAIDDFRIRSDEMNKRLEKLETMLKTNPVTRALQDEESTEQEPSTEVAPEESPSEYTQEEPPAE